VSSRRALRALVFALLLGTPFTLILTGAAQKGGATFDWRVELAANRVTPSTVTANNECKRTHRFQIEPDHLPFMELNGPASFDVAPGGQYVIPVEFNTWHMKPGSYDAVLTVRCVSCKEEPTCKEDHHDLHVFLTVAPGAPNWTSVFPDQKNPSAQNPAQLWVSIFPEKKPH